MVGMFVCFFTCVLWRRHCHWGFGHLLFVLLKGRVLCQGFCALNVALAECVRYKMNKLFPLIHELIHIRVCNHTRAVVFRGKHVEWINIDVFVICVCSSIVLPIFSPLCCYVCLSSLSEHPTLSCPPTLTKQSTWGGSFDCSVLLWQQSALTLTGQVSSEDVRPHDMHFLSPWTRHFKGQFTPPPKFN